MGNSGWRPAIALFSISRKINRPKGFYSAEWELTAAVWRQTNSSEQKDLNPVRTKNHRVPQGLFLLAGKYKHENEYYTISDMKLNAARSMWNKWFMTQQHLSFPNVLPKNISDFQTREETVKVSADRLLAFCNTSHVFQGQISSAVQI